MIVSAGVIIGAAISIIGTLFIDKIIWGLGASETLFPYCKQYLFILLLFTPASMMQVLFQNLIVTAGKPGFGMVLSMSAGAINVLLDYVFVVPMDMGIGFFAQPNRTLRFQKPLVDFRVLWQSCSNGFSEMVSQIAAAVTTFLFFLLTALYIGFSMGVAPILSYNFGSKDYNRLRKIFRMCMFIICIASVIVFAVTMLFGSPLVSIFSAKGTAV